MAPPIFLVVTCVGNDQFRLDLCDYVDFSCKELAGFWLIGMTGMIVVDVLIVLTTNTKLFKFVSFRVGSYSLVCFRVLEKRFVFVFVHLSVISLFFCKSHALVMINFDCICVVMQTDFWLIGITGMIILQLKRLYCVCMMYCISLFKVSL